MDKGVDKGVGKGDCWGVDEDEVGACASENVAVIDVLEDGEVTEGLLVLALSDELRSESILLSREDDETRT